MKTSFLLSLSREPLCHFLAAALLIGAYYGYVAEPYYDNEEVVLVSEERVNQILTQWQERWRRLPTPTELDNEIANLVQQELLFREGITLGLDNDDSFVRNRIIQKMRYLIDASIEEPSDSDLREWFEKRIDKYASEPLLSFEQLLLNDQFQDQELASLIDSLNQEELDSVSVSKEVSLDQSLDRVSKSEVRRQFGDRFVNTLMDLPENTEEHSAGVWIGSARSGFGIHLLRNVTIEVQTDLDLQNSELKQRVRNDWIADAKKRALESKLVELSGQYKIQIEK